MTTKSIDTLVDNVLHGMARAISRQREKQASYRMRVEVAARGVRRRRPNAHPAATPAVTIATPNALREARERLR
jgi:hypothetical protein